MECACQTDINQFLNAFLIENEAMDYPKEKTRVVPRTHPRLQVMKSCLPELVTSSLSNMEVGQVKR